MTDAETGLDSELRGPRGVRRDVTEFLRAWLPVHAPACAAAWDTTIDLPISDPGNGKRDAYVDREPSGIDRWPLISVQTGRWTLEGLEVSDDGSPVMVGRYPIRVFSWVKANGTDATQAARDDLATAITITLLAHVNLDQPAGRLSMVPSSLVTDFSTVQPVNGDRFVAGSYVGFDLRVLETLTDRLALPGGQPRDTVARVHAEGVPYPQSEETP